MTVERVGRRVGLEGGGPFPEDEQAWEVAGPQPAGKDGRRMADPGGDAEAPPVAAEVRLREAVPLAEGRVVAVQPDLQARVEQGGVSRNQADARTEAVDRSDAVDGASLGGRLHRDRERQRERKDAKKGCAQSHAVSGPADDGRFVLRRRRRMQASHSRPATALPPFGRCKCRPNGGVRSPASRPGRRRASDVRQPDRSAAGRGPGRQTLGGRKRRVGGKGGPLYPRGPMGVGVAFLHAGPSPPLSE